MSFASGFFSFNGLLNIATAGGTICSFYLTIGHSKHNIGLVCDLHIMGDDYYAIIPFMGKALEYAYYIPSILCIKVSSRLVGKKDVYKRQL